MPDQITLPPEPESALDRAQRIRVYIEQLIETTGEHPECELKLTWKRDTLYLKAEFIKDVQAIANSSILEGREKYIVVGARQRTKEIEGCDHSEFDDADIRVILENHLDPVPEFEIFCLQSSKGKDFVVVRIPHQPGRPFVVKTSIRENKNLFLEQGQIWIKPGGLDTSGSGKRLLNSRSELISLINTEPDIRRGVSERLETLIPQIRLEERTRLQGQTATVVSVLASTDQEFESYLVQLLATPNKNHFNIIVETLRENTVEVWEIGLEPYQRLSLEEMEQIKERQFLPALRRVVLTGLLLIKFSAPMEWFYQVADLLHKIFEASRKLINHAPTIDERARSATLEEHLSFSVPALESLLAAYLIAGYELTKRDGNNYIKSLLNRVVNRLPSPYEYQDERQREELYMFWPVRGGGGYPNLAKHQMAIERYSNGDRIEKLLGGKEGIKSAVLQIDCLIDWHSFLGCDNLGEPETIEFFRTCYPRILPDFYPDYTYERYEYILPLIQKLWRALHRREKEFWSLNSRLPEVIDKIEMARREKMLGKFLLLAERNQGKWMWNNGRMGYDMPWPQEISKVINLLRSE